MSSTFLTALQSPLRTLAETSPVPTAEVPAKVEEIWQHASSSRPAQENDDQQAEAVKAVLEVVSRELTVQPLAEGTLLEPPLSALAEEKQAFQEALQYRLDIVLALFESAYASLQKPPGIETGAMFLPLLEELVELMSVESWRDMWRYVETRSKRFTQDMPASRGKALPLLRTINAFLRSLPRTPEDLVFRGRVHQFASSVISIADKSAINLRGDYNELKTVWEDGDQPQVDVEEVKAEAVVETGGKGEGDADGDVKMDADADESKTETKESAATTEEQAKPEFDFYSTLWSLQQYFAHPPSLATQPTAQPATPRTPRSEGATTTTPFATFRQKSDLVLPILFEQTKKQKELMGREADGGGPGRKRKREEATEDGGFFYPRYLTGKRLLEHELADPSFRRQILVQYFILFQFLLHLTPATASKQAFTGGMPKNFVIESEDETWVKEKVSAIREELRKMPVDGVRFEKTVLSIITREFHYATWKNEGCPEGVFEVPPLDKGSAEERAQLWKRRLAPPRRFRFNVGTMSLSDMWRGGYADIDQLRNWKRKSDVDSLYKEVEAIDADEADDKAMGEVPAEKLTQNEERRTSLTWRALRLRTQTDIRSLSALKTKRDLHTLFRSPPAKTAPKAIAESEVKTEVADARLSAGGADSAPDQGEGESIMNEDNPEAVAKAEPEAETEGEKGVVDDVERSEEVAVEQTGEDKAGAQPAEEPADVGGQDEEMPSVTDSAPAEPEITPAPEAEGLDQINAPVAEAPVTAEVSDKVDPTIPEQNETMDVDQPQRSEPAEQGSPTEAA